jgi:hypothetical protein
MPTQAGNFPVTVQARDASGRSAQASTVINILPPALKITDGLMQLGVVQQPFDHVVAASGGTPPYNFTLSTGALAPGLQLNASTGEISGSPTSAGYYQFNIQVTDSTTPTAFSIAKPYNLLITAAALAPRNDTLANATQVFPGTYLASLSPYTDSSGNPAPDHDYYVLAAAGGSTYDISASNQYFLWPASGNPDPHTAPTDPALEIVDATGTPMTICNDPLADNPPAGAPITKGAGNFTDACINHGGNNPLPGTASLSIELPPGSNQAIYIHVFDFQGRARPDFIYSLQINKR